MGVQPEGTGWLANELRLSKGGYMYFWRSYLDPIWNHYIRGPVRVWSVEDGPDERVLTALKREAPGRASSPPASARSQACAPQPIYRYRAVRWLTASRPGREVGMSCTRRRRRDPCRYGRGQDG